MRHTVLLLLMVLAVSSVAPCLADVGPGDVAKTQELSHGPFADPVG